MSAAAASQSGSRAGSPFDPRVVLGLLLFGALAFIAALYFIGTGEPSGDENNGGGHAASTGLNGFAGLEQLLEADGHNVSLVRNAAELDDANLLILTPPHAMDGEELAQIVEKRRYAGPTIIVLPKWFAFPIGKIPGVKAKRGWVMLGSPTTPSWPGFHDDISVKIAPSGAAKVQPDWAGAGLAGSLPDPAQVLSGSGAPLAPIVAGAGDSAVLAAYVNDGGVYPALEEMAGTSEAALGENESIYPLVFVFEPDLMNNYGLADRNRAMLALRIVDAAIDGEDLPIVFDLTLNGLGGTKNLLTLAFTPPFLAATLCLLIAAIVVAWRAFRRFGPPLAEVSSIAFGKRQLAINGAALIQRSQRLHLLGTPYAALMRGRLAHALGLKTGSDAARTDAEIDRLLNLRGISGFLEGSEALRRARSPHDLLRRAHALRQIERKLEQ